MNKDLIINKIVKDLPIKEMRSQMSDVEWFGWFEEVWDKAINYTHCYTTCKPILEDRITLIQTEPSGIVRETMIDNLLIGLDDL